MAEWCRDRHAENYGDAANASRGSTSPPVTDPVGAATGDNRVIKGGWFASDAAACRCVSRFYAAETKNYTGVGFGCVASSKFAGKLQ